MFQVSGLFKSNGKEKILNGISFKQKKGSCTCIFGPKGAGKTALLRIIDLLDEADSGIMTLDGITVDFEKLSRQEIMAIRRKTAFVFQNHNLFNNKSVIENVTEGLIIRGSMTEREAREIAMDALEKVELSDKAGLYPDRLTESQKHRTGIARAMVLKPEFILMDEPTSEIDSELAGKTMDIIRKIKSSGMTLLIVTNDLACIQDIADRAIFMEEGYIVEEGSVADIFFSPKEERTKRFLSGRLPGEPMYNI